MRGSSGGRPDTYCRPCRSEYGKEHYAANRERYIDQTRVRNRKRLHERVAFLVDYFKSHPCTDCGESDPVVLDFDHLRDKEFDVAYGIHYRAWAKVLAEIEKCEVVCSNCHRRRTARRRGSIRLLLSGLE
jgi:5-methylcytosine-specific restriction endonuclease McrA